jgi:DNA topoisomerase-3
MMQKKNIRCTPKGKQLIETLPIKELMDLDYTGKLEKTLADIEKSAVSKEIFMNHIIRFVVKGVSEIKGQSVPTEWKKNTKPTEKEVLGSCPLCGQDVVEGERGFGCMGYKSGCHFVIWKADEKLAFYHKKATKTMVKSLLKKGEATVKGFKTPKGTKFDAKVKYAYHNDQKMGEWFFEKV